MPPPVAERRGSLWMGLVVVALLAAACGSANPEPNSVEIEVFGPWRGDQAEAFRQTLSVFESESGIRVRYTGTSDVIRDLEDRLARADEPDVAILPRPGVIQDLFSNGYILGLPDDVRAVVDDNYREDLAGITAIDNIMNSVMIRVSVKDLVWYRPDHFAEMGYETPQEWSDLLTLVEQMIGNGIAPWCMGIEAFESSGWPGTDWVEQIVLGSFPPDVYDGWAAMEIPFTDPQIRDAFDLYATMALRAGSARGGPRGVVNTPVSEAVLPLLDDPQGCGMHRQASFTAANLPEGTVIGADGDVDVFTMPGFPGIEPPLHVGGDFAVAFRDDAAVWALLSYLATPASAEVWPAAPGNIAPHLSVDLPDSFSRRVADLLAGAAEIRFDGSDLLPIRAGQAFNGGIVQLISTGDVDAATEAIQEVVEEELARLTE